MPGGSTALELGRLVANGGGLITRTGALADPRRLTTIAAITTTAAPAAMGVKRRNRRLRVAVLSEVDVPVIAISSGPLHD